MPHIEKSNDQSENAQSSRDLILQSVGELLNEQQSADCSLSDIGRKTGLNPALVNYYFGTKSRMMADLVIETIGPSVKQLDDLLNLDMPADEKMVIHIQGIVDTFYDYPFVNRLLHRVSRLDDGQFAKELADQIITPVYKAERKILAQGVREGKFRKINSMFFYFIVTGVCDAIFHGRYALRHTFGRETISKRMKMEYTKQVTEIVLKGIAA